MNTFRKILLTLLLTGVPFYGKAQDVLWDVDFKLGFDNREYNREQSVPDGTVIGADIIPKIGLSFVDNNSIYAGIDLRRYFGKISPKYETELLLYYQFDGDHLFVNAGAFPSKNMKAYYPSAFMGDSRFFYNVLEGALIRYERKDWMLEAASDWAGEKEENNRERFLVFSGGRYQHHRFPYLYAAYAFMMHHFACSKTIGGVVDNIWVYPYIGFDVSPLLPSRMKLTGNAGYIKTFQNDRRTNEGYITPGGYHLCVNLEYYGFGIENILYMGDNLLPFYYSQDSEGNQYGDDLYLSDPFYATTFRNYDQLAIYYHYPLNDMLDLSLASVTHITGKYWNWQQLLRLTVNLNNRNFRKKNGHAQR